MIAAGITDRGKVRQENQDNYYVDVLHDRGQALVVICDGMGGAKAGDVASEMATELFVAEVKKRFTPSMKPHYMREVMAEAVKAANAVVFERSGESDALSGMGTTIVAALIDHEDCVIMNVGDSRAYLLSGGGIRRVTNDHSLAEELLRQGRLTPRQAKAYPAKNMITRAVGTEGRVEPEFYAEKLAQGDIVLLCSDGLTNMVTDDEILSCVQASGDIFEAGNRLVALANERGGHDNITVVMLGA